VTDDEPSISYRLTAPPYIDYKDYYAGAKGCCQLQLLLEPPAQRILQQEVASIPQWTAWPEQQHYRAPADIDGPAPWNVFPLCHCFPANDVTHRQWIPATAAHVPKTVQLLKDVVGDTLRTALFSRLDPDSVLEAHTGWADLANHVYRVHVPISIPDGNLCGTWVDGCVVTHSPTALIAFDDSKTHRAFNYSAHSRVVLILDLERPSHLPTGTATGGHSEELDPFIAQFAAPK
jgi:Aspartyl/Asparaginyl beta-hydroxylase